MISIILMLIGGASGSTAGGVKVGTFGLVIYSAICIAGGRTDVVLYRRRIATADILRAVSLVVICVLLVFSATVVMMEIEGAALGTGEDISFVTLMFEAASALTTTGFSMGVTSQLSAGGKLFIIMLMIIGRLGPFTILLFLVGREKPGQLKYPEERVIIG